jgi:hypothetical protein
MGTIIVKDVFRRNWRTGTLRGKDSINYKPFRDLADCRRRDVLSREHFIVSWGNAQRDQGITVGKRP